MKEEFLKHEHDITYYTSPLFDGYGVAHAFTTRAGGVSKGVFESLNFAIGTGTQRDTQENVVRNHSIAAKHFGLTESDICRSFQNHSSNVEIVGLEHKGTGICKEPFPYGVDGLVTTERDMILSVRTADCVPVLLYDYKNKVCAAVHAGWRGTLAGITVNALEKMYLSGASSQSIIAAIGPCIGACCYEVGSEVYEAFTEKDKDFSLCFTDLKDDGKSKLDLTTANEIILKKAGLKENNISSSFICTSCNPKDFFSHRRMGANRGTMSALIVNK